MRKNLTLVFPTYNRGKRLYHTIAKLSKNVENLYPTIILDNSSSREVEYYNKINDLSKKSVGLKYVKQEYNKGLQGNLASAFDHVKTEYFMVIADEDEPAYENLYDIEVQLASVKNIASARASTGSVSNYNVHNVQYKTEVFNPSSRSIEAFGLWGNYISGGIFNTSVMKENGSVKLLKERGNLQHDSPHVFLYMLAATKAKTMLLENVGCFVGKPEQHGGYETFGDTYFGPYSFGSRIDQFFGFRKLILSAYRKDECNLNENELVHLLVTLCKKYIYLVCAANMPKYYDNFMEPKYLGASFLHYCLSSLYDIPEFKERSEPLKQLLVDYHNNCYENFLKSISQLKKTGT